MTDAVRELMPEARLAIEEALERAAAFAEKVFNQSTDEGQSQEAYFVQVDCERAIDRLTGGGKGDVNG